MLGVKHSLTYLSLALFNAPYPVCLMYANRTVGIQSLILRLMAWKIWYYWVLTIKCNNSGLLHALI